MVSAEQVAATFFLVITSMLIIFSLIFAVWAWVLIVIIITSIILGIAHYKRDDNLFSERFDTPRRTRSRTVYSLRSPVRDRQKEKEEAELRKIIKKKFEEVSLFDDAERLK